jgi:hypothetical protein
MRYNFQHVHVQQDIWKDKLEESLRDYCPIIIVKEEADRRYRSGVFAQELYSLFLNKTLELYLNTMENIVFEFSILYIVYCIEFIVYHI